LGEIIKVNPVLGLGPANYYWYTPLYAIRGYKVEFNSHNQYIDLLAQIGIVGTAFVLWFFVEAGILGWKLLKVVPEGFPKAYVYGAMGGLIATVISGTLGDWFLPFVYNVGILGMRSSILGWVFLGALVALEQMYMPKTEGDNSGAS
jgi:O-antigen ligase